MNIKSLLSALICAGMPFLAAAGTPVPRTINAVFTVNSVADSVDVTYDLVTSQVFSTEPAAASLGQYVFIKGGGFVGGSEAGTYTEVELSGYFNKTGMAPVPVGMGVFGLRFENRPVKIDEPLMTEIAATTGGRYFRAQDAQALERLEKLLAREKELEKKLRALEQKLASGAGGTGGAEQFDPDRGAQHDQQQGGQAELGDEAEQRADVLTGGRGEHQHQCHHRGDLDRPAHPLGERRVAGADPHADNYRDQHHREDLHDLARLHADRFRVAEEGGHRQAGDDRHGDHGEHRVDGREADVERDVGQQQFRAPVSTEVQPVGEQEVRGDVDAEVGREFTALVERLFDREARCYGDKEHAVHDTALRAELAQRYGLDYVTAAQKTVPHCVRTSGHKMQRAFLSALFESDGWIDTSSTVGLGTASEQLARQVQLLLYGLGVPATVSSSFNTSYERDHWTVTITPSVVHRFLDEIGFRSTRRAAHVAANFHRASGDAQFEDVPNIVGLIRDLRDDLGGDRALDRCAGDLFRTDMALACSRQRLAKILAWADDRMTSWTPTSRAIVEYLRHLLDHRYTFERVDAIEDAGLQPTFDVVLPRTHSFIANGMLSHNTTVALHAIAEAQKNGGIAAFIDAEHALDPTYAAGLGVDIESPLVSQPGTGEAAAGMPRMPE